MRRGSVPSRLFIAVSLVVGLSSLGVRADAAAPIACGATVTTSFTLRHDLLQCPGDGLIIGADDIVVDLGGHKITGNDPLTDHKGLRLEGHTGVTVKNGIVRHFFDDVYLHNETDSTVKTIHASVAGYPIHVCDSSHNTIKRNVLGATPNAGIMLNCTTNTNNDIRANKMHNDTVGIQLEAASNNTIANNVMSKTTTGVFANVGSADNLIQSNVILGNLSSGIQVTGNNNTLLTNVVRGSNIGIEVASNASGNSLIRNRTKRSVKQGIYVRSTTTHTTLAGNVAKYNRDDGIRIDADEAATSIKNSVADFNHAGGINAAHNVADGGGNEAHGNAPGQNCTSNLTCSHG